MYLFKFDLLDSNCLKKKFIAVEKLFESRKDPSRKYLFLMDSTLFSPNFVFEFAVFAFLSFR